MANDPRVEGEDAETPADSPSETITPEPSGDENESASPASPEEVAWSDLKGNTQDRIKQILRERDEEKAKRERIESFVQTQNFPQQQNTFTQNPEIQSAVAKLSEVGMATKDWAKQEINQSLGNLIYNFELGKLEERHDGSDGLPKFDKAEYQDFIQRNPKYSNYDPEDVFEKMYSEEILDAKVKTYKSGGGQSTTPSLRPTKTTVREEQWSPEWIENRMKQSDGLDWYWKNKDKVNNFLASLPPAQ